MIGTIKKPRLVSLDFLKLIALFSVFWWHSPMIKPPVDLGARACEFLFVCSGFLVAYNYAYKYIECTWRECLKRFLIKFISFFPLHFIVSTFYFLKGDINTQETLKYFIKLFFLEPWSGNMEIFFAMNGVSWFLSVLLICYFLSPVLLKFLKKNLTKNSIILVIIFSIRLSIEIITKYSSLNYLNVSVHVHPIFRSLEFLMGMLIYPFYEVLMNKVYKLKYELILLLLKFLCIGLTILLMIKYNEIWFRAFYVLYFTFIVLIFSLQYRDGNSFIFIRKIVAFLSNIQFEFYLLHAFGIYIWQICLIKLSKYISINNKIYISSFVLLPAFIILISYGFKKFFSKKICRLMTIFINRIFLFFEISSPLIETKKN